MIYIRKKKSPYKSGFLPAPLLLKETHHTLTVLLQVHGQKVLDALHGYGNGLLRLYDPHQLRCWWLYQIYVPLTEVFRNRGSCPIYCKTQIHDVSPHLQLRSHSLQFSVSNIRLKPPLTQIALICITNTEEKTVSTESRPQGNNLSANISRMRRGRPTPKISWVKKEWHLLKDR